MERDEELKAKYAYVTESKKAAPIAEKQKAVFERLVANQEKYLKENTFAGDMARLGQVLIPVYRRAFPQMIAKDIVGVQPLSQPTGYAFALRYSYTGNKTNQAAGGNVKGGKNAFAVPPYDNQRYESNSVLVVFNSSAHRVTHAGTVNANAASFGALPGGSEITAALPTGGTAVVVYTEDNKALIKVGGDVTGQSPVTAIRNTIAAIKALAGTISSTITDAFDNEAGYAFILKSYPGLTNTLAGETAKALIQELGLTIDKIPVVADVRKLRARYTLEAAQDLKAVHGKDLATELVDILTYEISQSIDRAIIAAIDSAAVYTSYNLKDTSTGRWQAEYFLNAYTEIVRKANDIARTTLRGPGNFIIGHSDVCTMMERLPQFALNPTVGDVHTNSVFNNTGTSFVGTIGGRFNVYRDIFAADKTALIGFKGASAYESGVIYSPYIPLEMKETVDPEDASPAIIFMERSAITANPFAADLYYRKVLFNGLFT